MVPEPETGASEGDPVDRITAPMGPYTRSDVAVGAAIYLLGITVTVVVPILVR